MRPRIENSGCFMIMDSLKTRREMLATKTITCQQPDMMFNENYIFVHNKFHQTIISTKSFKAINHKDNDEIKFTNFLKDRNVCS